MELGTSHRNRFLFDLSHLFDLFEVLIEVAEVAVVVGLLVLGDVMETRFLYKGLQYWLLGNLVRQW
jgi:hypothetical protein